VIVVFKNKCSNIKKVFYLINIFDMISQTKLEEIAKKYNIWIQTLTDIFAELERPGLDPRDEIEPPKFRSDVLDIKDLKIWDILDWVIRNVVDFGAFVDIWLHSDWFVHKSEIADFFVDNPINIISVWQQVKARVIWIEKQRDKVSMSMKWINNYLKTKNTKYFENTNNKNNKLSSDNLKIQYYNDENTNSETKIKWNITFS